ncbi:RHS repeat-associated core domain-containing protein [Coraliomargarita sp. SDUM461003]|uniref:RHS repeat-associated core domain-containing protein n=1 Tax=Thalassobacterium maritimum TaxID=3041265 RepID=A0ABU1ANZ5_9BACT|nr:RHS repeat-associated core domain-containing protein [Coraliomargarita sp. SDUM461003]MDQ8205894.1 RHS repeat-associated core domain-containing protein [Coraliomargarita sp. SDUM461003]
MNILKETSLLVAALIGFSVLPSQGNPLWEDVSREGVGIVGVGSVEEASANSLQEESSTSFQMMSLTVPESISAEVQSLADALEGDPVRIFNYVRNNIDYEAYHGLRKGASLTLLEGAGNDFDQCLLLGELLTASGITDYSYIYRGQRVDYDYLVDWIGLADEPFPGETFIDAYGQAITDAYPGGQDNGVGDYVAKRATFAGTLLSSRGLDGYNGNVAVWFPDFPSTANVVIKRMYVALTVGGTTYDLDPSYKTYETIDGVDALLSSAGYDRSQLLTDAGGNAGAGYIQNLSNTNISSYLDTLSADLVQELEDEYPDITFREVISGRRISIDNIESLSEAFPLPKVFFGSATTWSDITQIPNSLKTKVRFQVSGGIDATLYTSELEGKKITLDFSGNTVRLRLDDGAPIDTATVSGATFDMTATVTHPGTLGSKSETKTYKKNDGFAYAIIYGFAPSGRLLQKRYDQLNAYLDDGKADDSREVRTELLNIMGLTWMYQTELCNSILASQNDVLHVAHHRFGRMSQEEGFYVDVGLQLSSSVASDGVFDDGRRDNVFHLGSLFASAMEHGIIEQMQPGSSAISTVNILRKANADGQRLYLTDSTNWNTGTNVKSKLSGYSSSLKGEFQDYILNDDAKMFLPKNFGVSQDQWSGSGWVIRSPTQAGMIISGGYSGGYSTNYGYVSSPNISTSSYYNPTYTYNPPSIPAIKPYVPPSYTTPSFYGSDPVDMATGAFTFSHTDLETGVDPSPRGLSFARHYSSSGNDRDRQNLGYGWTHMFHMRAAERTAIEESLGLGTYQQAASILTATLVASDLYRHSASPKEWGVSALTVGWYLDSLINNAVSITIGNNSFQFIKQPDGSYEPPASSTMQLSKDGGGNYVLSRQHGNSIYFEPTQDVDDESLRVERIEDPDGNVMSFEYYADDRINYVEDAFGRRYTITYYTSGVNIDRIKRITDSTDNRFVEYRYDSEGNLDRITDPEGKYFYFDYEVAGDPSATVASEHRIVRMRNHDDETITQNVYDELGRVVEQYLHGDQSKTWKLSYTGVENYEEDPEGGITTYFYDERGRSTGKLDAEGNLSTWVYDGQDRIVQKISAEGETTKYYYDNDHNLIQIDYPLGGGSTINQYDSYNRLDLVTDPDGNETDYVYFSSGVNSDKNRPEFVIDEEGTTAFEYVASGAGVGHVWKVTDDDGLTTENAYDSYGQPDWTKAPGGYQTDFQYTSRGDLDYLVDPNGTKTDYSYNARRQVTQVIYDQGGADEATEDRQYDNMGNLQSIILPQDNDSQRVKQTFDYSPTEKLTHEFLSNETASEGDDQIGEYVLDGRDWITQSYDAENRETLTVYYKNKEVEQIVRPGARSSSFGFDGDGRLIEAIRPGSAANREYEYEYSVSDMLIGDVTDGYPKEVFTDADLEAVTKEYDRTGNLRFYKNKHAEVFEMRYDGLGRPTHVITPLDADNSRAHVTNYTHRGAPLLVTEPSGQTASYAYDPTSGRLSSIAYSNGAVTETVNFSEYDGNGNIEEISEGADTIQRDYDALNRVVEYTDVNGNSIGYRYYDSGNIAKIIYPGGSESGVGHVEYTYWKTGRLKQVIDKLDSVSSPRITQLYWHADGRLDRLVRPNGTERQIQYDAAGRPQIVEEFSAAGQLIALYKNNYFPSDELEWIYQLPQSQSSAAPSVVNSMTYNEDNQLATFEGQSVTHDADGNMTYGPLPDGTFATYDYDTRNRLESADGISYSYDPEGERKALSGNGSSVSYVNENNLGLSKLIQRTKDGQTVRYVWGVGLLYEVDGSGSATYYHYDNVGSTIALSNDAAQVIERIEYSPFGAHTYRQRTSGFEGALHDTPFLWTGFFGNQTDENGLVYLRNRYYNPTTRRFVNSDPAREAWNWYAYAGGNPMSFVDPTGLGLSSALDSVQTGLSFLGLIPVVGNVFDVVNAGISAGRGNYADAALNLAASLPGVGQAATGAKFAGVGFGLTKFSKATNTLARNVDNVPASLLRGNADTSVYLGLRNGQPVYTGISKDIAKRQAQHGDRFVLQNITSDPLTRRQARAIEQALINRNPGFENKINSISPKRDWYQEAVNWGESWLQSNGF